MVGHLQKMTVTARCIRIAVLFLQFGSIVEAFRSNIFRTTTPISHRILAMSTSNGAWLPVASASLISSLQPLQIEIVGEKYVVWRSSDASLPEADRWSVMPDACPHRKVPLSEGRVDTLTNCIECPYHGWQFDTDGNCKSIPTLDVSRKTEYPIGAKATSLPVKLIGDMLWSFIPLPEGQADHFPSDPLEVFPHMINYTKPWFSRELPYSFDFLIENFMDPAHIPFAHHKLQGTRNDAGEIPQQSLTKLENSTHCEVAFQDVTRNKSRDGIVSFVAPCFYHFRVFKNSTNRHEFGLFSLVVPVRKGMCRLFLAPFNSRRRIPPWFLHFFSNKFLDSDLWLNSAEYYVRNQNKNSLYDTSEPGVSQSEIEQYVIASSADVAPIFFRRWWSKHMSLSKVFGVNLCPSIIPIEQQLDRYENHSKHCSSCLKCLERANKFKSLAPVMTLLVLALSSSISIKVGAVVLFGFSSYLTEILIKGVNGPGRGAKVSASKFAPES